MRHALPEGVADAVLNRSQIARALNVTEPTVDRMIDEGMPVAQEGGNGRAYEFQLSECWNWKCERDDAKRSADEQNERAVQQMRLALIGGTTGENERALSPKERGEIYDAEHKYMAAAAARGELIPRGNVIDMLEDVFATVRDALGTLPDRLQRECGLDGAQVESAIRACDDALNEMNRRLDKSELAKAAPASDSIN